MGYSKLANLVELLESEWADSEKARIEQREILRAFLERGISPTLTDAKGKSVREWTKSDWIHKMLAGDVV